MVDQEFKIMKLCYDVAFKSIFINCTSILYQMISDITGISINELNKDAIIFNSELEIKHVKSKRMLSDLIILCNNKIINIEINKSYQSWTYNRNISYLCNIYSSLLRKTNNYNKFTRYELYQINLNIGKNTPCTYSKDMIIDTKTSKIATNFLRIYNINIDKCYKVLYNEEKKKRLSKIVSWGALFNASTIYEVKEIIKKGEILMFDSQEELIKEIKKKNGMFTLENLWDYEAEKIRIQNTIKEEAYEKGMKKGIKDGKKVGMKEGMKEGIKEGMKEGILQKEKQIVINMLNNNFSYDDIAKATGISKSKIKEFIL